LTTLNDISNPPYAKAYNISEVSDLDIAGTMLTLIIIIALIAAASAATLLLRRTNRSSEMLGPHALPGAENFRPLFEPTKEELEAAELEMKLLQHADKERHSLENEREAAAELDRVRAEWLASRSRTQTILLLYEAAKSQNDDIYLKICEEVLQQWRTGSVDDLSADDLAQLMESHYWLIPADKRTAGVGFRINKEIAGLRSGSFHPK
jgi:hypothetical protein